MGGGNFVNSIINGTLQNQDSFGNWINHIIADSPCSVDDSGLESSVSSVQDSYSSRLDNHQPLTEQLFNITDVSPVWACSTEKTKVCFPSAYHLASWSILSLLF